MIPRFLLDRLGVPDDFRSGVLTLLTGSVAAAVIGYAAQPVLTRLFPPEAFGVMDAFVALVAMIAPWTAARYEDALLIPEEEDDAAALLRLVLGLTVGSVLLLQLIVLANVVPLDMLGLAALVPWMALLPGAILLVRLSAVLEGWYTRGRRFHAIALGQTIQSSCMSGTRVGAGALTSGVPGPLGLIAGYLAGYGAASIYYAVSVVRSAGSVLRGFRPAAVRSAAHRYKRFATFGMPAALLSSFTARLPFLILLAFFDEAMVGYFGRAFATVAIPLGLVSTAVARVFFVEATEARRSDGLATLTSDVHARLVSLGIFPALAVVIAGPQLFSFVFGSDWRLAGEFARLVAVWLFLASVASPLTRLFDVLERQRSELAFSAILFLIQTSALIGGSLLGDSTLALAGLALGGILGRSVQIAGMARMAGAPLLSLGRAYGRYFSLSIPGCTILFVGVWLPGDLPAFAGLIFATIVYAALVVWRDRLLSPRDGGQR